MAAPLVLPALLLALTLAVSGALKLRDPVTTADAFVALRLPARLRAAPIPVLLPYAELLLALGLLLVPSPGYIGVTIVAAVLFVAYLVVVARALGFDEPVECGCFGRLGLGEIDRRTVIRNALLAALAVVALADGLAGHSVIHRLVSFDATQWLWLLGVGVAVGLTWLVVGRPAERPAMDPPVDEPLDYVRRPIPYGALRNRVTGEAVPLGELGAGRPTLLVFLSMTCGPCARTMDLLPEWARRHPLVRVVAVPPAKVPAELADLGDEVTWMEDPGAAVARTFGASYPSAVLLGIDELLAGGPEWGFDGIRDFLDDISQQLADAGVAPDGRRAGEHATAARAQ